MSGRFEHLYDQGMEQSRSAQQIEQDWDHVASLAADLHDAHARLVDFVATVLSDGSWQAAGLRSPEHWLMLRAGLSRGQAAAVILLARRAGELPATAAALREGRISLDQAAVVARHTPAAFDATVAAVRAARDGHPAAALASPATTSPCSPTPSTTAAAACPASCRPTRVGTGESRTG